MPLLVLHLGHPAHRPRDGWASAVVEHPGPFWRRTTRWVGQTNCYEPLVGVPGARGGGPADGAACRVRALRRPRPGRPASGQLGGPLSPPSPRSGGVRGVHGRCRRAQRALHHRVPVRHDGSPVQPARAGTDPGRPHRRGRPRGPCMAPSGRPRASRPGGGLHAFAALGPDRHTGQGHDGRLPSHASSGRARHLPG